MQKRYAVGMVYQQGPCSPQRCPPLFDRSRQCSLAFSITLGYMDAFYMAQMSNVAGAHDMGISSRVASLKRQNRGPTLSVPRSSQASRPLVYSYQHQSNPPTSMSFLKKQPAVYPSPVSGNRYRPLEAPRSSGAVDPARTKMAQLGDTLYNCSVKRPWWEISASPSAKGLVMR